MTLVELISAAKLALEYADSSAKNGFVASCSYELETALENLKAARKSCIAKIRSDRAREEEKSPL